MGGQRDHDSEDMIPSSRGSRDTSGGHTWSGQTWSDRPPTGSHPAATSTRWGQQIGESRQAELHVALEAWKATADHGTRRGPFDGTPLTGADVYWLAERVRDAEGNVPDLHLETLSVIPPGVSACGGSR